MTADTWALAGGISTISLSSVNFSSKTINLISPEPSYLPLHQQNFPTLVLLHLSQTTPCCRGLSHALEGGQQHPWPLLPDAISTPLLPVLTTKRCLQIAPKGEGKIASHSKVAKLSGSQPRNAVRMGVGGGSVCRWADEPTDTCWG